ncbi:hypothetical protein ACVI53_002860 [Bradyrhizobium barranii subsp. barranii]
MIWTPTGSPEAVRSIGTAVAGSPQVEAGSAQMKHASE